MFSRRAIAAFLFTVTIALSVSCGKEETSAPAGGPVWKPSGAEGNITGVISGFTVSSVPEPASLGLIGLGVLGVSARRRRQA